MYRISLTLRLAVLAAIFLSSAHIAEAQRLKAENATAAGVFNPDQGVLIISDGDVYSMNPDGTGRRRLSFPISRAFGATGIPIPPNGVGSASWSADGKKIHYSRYQPPPPPAQVGGTNYYVANADGSVPVDGPFGFGVSYSGDGQKVVSYKCVPPPPNGSGYCTLSVQNPDGGNEVPLSIGTQFSSEFEPSFSPDGTKIVFVCIDGFSINAIRTICTANADGTNLVRLNNGNGPFNHPVFSPDGTKIAYDLQTGGSDSDVYIMNADGSGVINLTNSPGYDADPVWSPDGNTILFTRRTPESDEVFSIGANGSDLTRLTNNSVTDRPMDWRRVTRQPNRTPFDFDGDSRADVSVFRPSNNIWYVRNAAGFSTMTWGETGDKLAPADYDGDWKTDIAIWRPSTGTWYVVRSQDVTFAAVQWGENGDLARPGDYNNDGRADLMVFRPSQNLWYVKNSTAAGTYGNNNVFAYGTSGDVPVSGDFDGDQRLDIALFRPSNNTWYLRHSHSSFNNFSSVAFGEPGDVTAPADFDGDGITDIAVWRPSTGRWYIRFSSTGTTGGETWGVAGDKPVPADYDGDGRAEMAVFRPSSSTWYMLSLDLGITVTTFGEGADQPVPNSYVP